MSWKFEVVADGSGKWCGNGQRFATYPEAEAAAQSLFNRWTLVTATRVSQSTDPVTE